LGGLKNGRADGLILLGLALLAAALIWIATPWGMGVEYDSVFYWSAAENLLQGRGLGRIDGAGEFIPLTQFPPLYPIALAAVAGISGTSVAAAARLISAVLFGLNLFLLGRLIVGLGAGSWIAFGSALVCLTAPTILERHLWAMSEPLYFAWLLCSLGFLSRSIDEPGNKWLLAAAAAAGLTTLTRYAGLSVLATGVIALLVFEARPRVSRLRRAALFATLAGLLPVAWQLRNLLVAGKSTNRVLLFHPPSVEQLREAGSTLADWVPYPALSAELRSGFLALVGLGALLLLVGWARRGGEARGNLAWRLASVAGLHGAVYLGFLGVSLTFFDASTRLRDRVLSPLFLVGVLLTAGLLALNRPAKGWGGVRIAALAVMALLVVPHSIGAIGTLRESREGLGFVSPAWRNSETVALTRQLGSDLQLFSNEAFPIYFLTGRPASWVPERIDPVKGAERSGYQQELEAMHASIDAGEAALILFHPRSLRPELPPLDELTAALEPTWVVSDGMIFIGSNVNDE
jgi:4-amino-4-deoxy-L-arabinose transferase-like glycosyltransferase